MDVSPKPVCIVPIHVRSQTELKHAFCEMRNSQYKCQLSPANVCVAPGSDELTDMLIRCFCEPGHDSILLCPPVYSMYGVRASLNNVAVVEAPLDTCKDFSLQLGVLKSALARSPRVKVIFLCSPGNPTGSLISLSDIKTILELDSWSGMLVVDEAYIDFASHPESSCMGLLRQYGNLMVLNTLSKAFGLAGIRVGFAAGCQHIVGILNKIKQPYNIGSLSSRLATAALTEGSLAAARHNINLIKTNRQHLIQELPKIKGVGRLIGGFDANFVLFEILDSAGGCGRPCSITAASLVREMKHLESVLIRYRGDEYGCRGCVRVSIGDRGENERFLSALSNVLAILYEGKVI